MLKYLVLALVSVSAFAKAPTNLPKSFTVDGQKVVFVDFNKAQYDITYDISGKAASFVATMEFQTFEKGFPIFDLVDAPASVELNAVAVENKVITTPKKDTTLRMAVQELAAGKHKLVIKGALKTLVKFEDSGVKSAFWVSDLSERSYIEKYLPTNMEYDQYKMNFHIEFKGGSAKQAVYTNGVVKQNGNIVDIDYPDYYNCSSIFFHTTPTTSVEETRFSYKSKDGRDLPVVIYQSKSTWSAQSTLEKFKAETIAVLAELEGDYGPFPHPDLTIYNAGSGGMEYQGATMTEFSALGHEMTHSYFARGVMPANGNSGWMDEAIASWRDNNYPTQSTMYGSSRMSNRGDYIRTTDTQAYSFGARFMSYLDGRFKAQGGLKVYLRHMVEQKLFQPLSIDEYIAEMVSVYNDQEVKALYKQYTYGSTSRFFGAQEMNHSVHRKMTTEQLQNHL